MKYKITLRGKTYEVEVEKGEAILLDEYEAKAPAKSAAPSPVQAAAVADTAAAAPAASSQPGNGNAINSPIPGTINAVKVTQGQNVKKGQVLIIIESMKMENEILAPSDGTVTSVLVSSGNSVATGTALLTIG